MNQKALSIPIYVFVIVLLIGFILVAAVTILMSWLSANKCIGLQSTCANARIKFCEEWHEKCSNFDCEPPSWNSELKTCETYERGTREVACTQPEAKDCKEAFEEE
jgi:hypothetical protein